jgi:hypothetical protein
MSSPAQYLSHFGMSAPSHQLADYTSHSLGMIDGWVSANNEDGSGLSHTNWDLNLARWCDDDGMWTCQHPAVSRTRKVYLRREVVGHWHTLDAWALLERAQQHQNHNSERDTQSKTESTTPQLSATQHSAIPTPRPAWRAAAVEFGDWLVQRQAANGSWPRAYQVTTTLAHNPPHDAAPVPLRATVSTAEPSTTSSVIPVRFLVRLANVTGNATYLRAAIAAANFAWAQ